MPLATPITWTHPATRYPVCTWETWALQRLEHHSQQGWAGPLRELARGGYHPLPGATTPMGVVLASTWSGLGLSRECAQGLSGALSPTRAATGAEGVSAGGSSWEEGHCPSSPVPGGLLEALGRVVGSVVAKPVRLGVLAPGSIQLSAGP